MTTHSIARPEQGEYMPYFDRYLAQVAEGDLVTLLEAQATDTLTLLGGLTEAQGAHRYAAGKWSIRQVVGHIADIERLFTFRALWFARKDPAPLPPMDENAWAEEWDLAPRTLHDAAEEFRVVRQATVALARSLTPELAARRGTASGNPASVRAMLWIAAGHERHHVNLLRERYLNGVSRS